MTDVHDVARMFRKAPSPDYVRVIEPAALDRQAFERTFFADPDVIEVADAGNQLVVLILSPEARVLLRSATLPEPGAMVEAAMLKIAEFGGPGHEGIRLDVHAGDAIVDQLATWLRTAQDVAGFTERRPGLATVEWSLYRARVETGA
jgi:hypothetical protein